MPTQKPARVHEDRQNPIKPANSRKTDKLHSAPEGHTEECHISMRVSRTRSSARYSAEVDQALVPARQLQQTDATSIGNNGSTPENCSAASRLCQNRFSNSKTELTVWVNNRQIRKEINKTRTRAALC